MRRHPVSVKEAMPELCTYKIKCTDITSQCFDVEKLRFPCQQHGPFIVLFYSLPHISVLHLLINMHIYAWISEGGLKNVCIYRCPRRKGQYSGRS